MKKNGQSPFWGTKIYSRGDRNWHWPDGCLSVCPCVQGLSLIAPDRRSRSGADKHHSMRQSAGTTMALVTWRHVARGTCHVPPREPLAKQHELDTFFEGTVAETWNLQGRCTLVWWMCHVSDDPVGSKLCPQGTIPFFSLMPSSSDTLGPGDTKFGTGVQCNKFFHHWKI